MHYELSHRTDIAENDMIGALSLGHGECGSRSIGQISDKTLYIALNYREQTEQANQSSKSEIARQLVELESQQRRLKYYVSLLDPRQAELLYFEGHSQEECANLLRIATRTVRRIKDEAIRELVELYCFMDGFSNQGCPPPVRQIAK